MALTYPNSVKIDKSNRDPYRQLEFLLKDENMKEKYLSAIFESCRWANPMVSMWEMSVKDTVSFVQNWMQQNKNDFQELFHHKKPRSTYELPHVINSTCHRNEKHSGKYLDLEGTIRCAHVTERFLKPNYVFSFNRLDPYSKLIKKEHWEDDIRSDCPVHAFDEKTGKLKKEYEEEWNNYQALLKDFNEKEATFHVKDICGAIISDVGTILSLEEVIGRLNKTSKFRTSYCPGYDGCTPEQLAARSLTDIEFNKGINYCPGHPVPRKQVVLALDGADLALYVQKWYRQLPDGTAPLFND